MQSIIAGTEYELEDGQHLKFASQGSSGTTNEELITVLIDRTEFLNDHVPCTENELAIVALSKALNQFNLRRQARLTQGVEGDPVPHVPLSGTENPSIVELPEKRISDLENLTSATSRAAATGSTEYMRGMANGLILALATIQGTEPVYVDQRTSQG
jgi:hypothetical protein